MTKLFSIVKLVEKSQKNFLVILVEKSPLRRAGKWIKQYQQLHILLKPEPNFEGKEISSIHRELKVIIIILR